MNTTTEDRPIIRRNSRPGISNASHSPSEQASNPQTSGINPDVSIDSSQQEALPQAPRRMQPARFAIGLLSTTIGMIMILLVGVKMLEVRQLGGNFALPLVAITVLTGVMLLGGGFGLMATASSGFDEQEFHRLMKAGNIASAEMAQATVNTFTVDNMTVDNMTVDQAPVPRQGSSEGLGGWGRSDSEPPAAGGSLSFDPSHPSSQT